MPRRSGSHYIACLASLVVNACLIIDCVSKAPSNVPIESRKESMIICTPIQRGDILQMSKWHYLFAIGNHAMIFIHPGKVFSGSTRFYYVPKICDFTNTHKAIKIFDGSKNDSSNKDKGAAVASHFDNIAVPYSWFGCNEHDYLAYFTTGKLKQTKNCPLGRDLSNITWAELLGRDLLLYDYLGQWKVRTRGVLQLNPLKSTEKLTTPLLSNPDFSSDELFSINIEDMRD